MIKQLLQHEINRQVSENALPIHLGALIDVLHDVDADRRVTYDFPGQLPDPDGLASYRGYYQHLALPPHNGRMCKVGQLLGTFVEAVGRVFTGYKGGKFTMDRETPVWCGYHSTTTQTAVAGVHVPDHGPVVIQTHYCDLNDENFVSSSFS